MRLDEALRKVGIEIVKNDTRGNQVVIHLRVTDRSAESWKQIMESFLLDSGDWTVDISKHFFPQGGVVRFLWRVVIGGNLANGAAAFGKAILGDLRSPQVELMEFPLVGRVEHQVDVATGRTKGAHSPASAAAIIAAATRGSS